jgi:HK97 family phage prohead protease
MSKKTQKRDIPALSMRGALSTVNSEKRTVDMVWTTGAKVLRQDWYDGPFFEELSLDPKHVRMDRLNSGAAPLLDSHRSYDGVGAVLGVIESARLEKGQGVATVRFPSEGVSPEADRVFALVRDGIVKSVSVGYRIHKFEKQAGGESETPVFRATDWEPYEVSVVAMPADAQAGFRSAEGSKVEPNACEFVFPLENRSMDENEKIAAQKAADEKRAADLKAATESAVKAAAQAERERAAAIRTAVRAAKLGEDLAEKLVNDGTPVDQARALVLEKLAARSEETPTQNHVPVTGGEDSLDKFVRGASAWLFEKAGLTRTIEDAAKREPKKFANVAVDGGEFRGMSLIDLARESLERRGVKTRGLDRMSLVGRAFTERAGGMTSTSDFAVLFENVMNKMLLGAYATTADTWRQFCKTDTVPDFRSSSRYRLGSFGALDSLNEHGEFKNKAIPDGSKSSISVGTKGNIIALTRQAIVNDDMGALAGLTTAFGRAAALSIEKDVYALLATAAGLGPTMADGLAFFDAGHGNISTGSAISVAGIDADRQAMAQQMDPSSNEYLDLRPSILLVPLSLGGQARVINDALYDQDVSNKFQIPNKVRGLFSKVIDTPRLSGTRRYLFTDPGVAAAIVVAFLEGQGEAPVLESELGWRVDGTEWKVRLDYKAQCFDPKAAVTNAGS